MTAPDVRPLVSTVGGGFLAGALAGYALNKVMKIAAVLVGLFIAALAYRISANYRRRMGNASGGITKCNYNFLKYTHTYIE
jgi:hypothetical protein